MQTLTAFLTLMEFNPIEPEYVLETHPPCTGKPKTVPIHPVAKCD